MYLNYRVVVEFFGFVPVDDIEPIVNVFGSPVLIFEVISVLPNVDFKNRVHSQIHGHVLVCRGDDFEVAVFVAHEPGPAGSETSQSGFFEGFLEVFKGTEIAVDRFRKPPHGGF